MNRFSNDRSLNKVQALVFQDGNLEPKNDAQIHNNDYISSDFKSVDLDEKGLLNQNLVSDKLHMNPMVKPQKSILKKNKDQLLFEA